MITYSKSDYQYLNNQYESLGSNLVNVDDHSNGSIPENVHLKREGKKNACEKLICHHCYNSRELHFKDSTNKHIFRKNNLDRIY